MSFWKERERERERMILSELQNRFSTWRGRYYSKKSRNTSTKPHPSGGERQAVSWPQEAKPINCQP
jgi:hypothetical protein